MKINSVDGLIFHYHKGQTRSNLCWRINQKNHLDPDILYTSKLMRSIETGLTILEVLHKTMD